MSSDNIPIPKKARTFKLWQNCCLSVINSLFSYHRNPQALCCLSCYSAALTFRFFSFPLWKAGNTTENLHYHMIVLCFFSTYCKNTRNLILHHICMFYRKTESWLFLCNCGFLRTDESRSMIKWVALTSSVLCLWRLAIPINSGKTMRQNINSLNNVPLINEVPIVMSWVVISNCDVFCWSSAVALLLLLGYCSCK